MGQHPISKLAEAIEQFFDSFEEILKNLIGIKFHQVEKSKIPL
jgi:hypothetical protein